MGKLGYYTRDFENPLSGNTMYVAALAKYSVLDEEAVINLAAQDSNLNKGDMAVAFTALSQAIENFVLNGHSVTIAGLGNFRLTSKSGVWDEKKKKWKSGGSDSMDKVTPDKIRGVYVRFRPCRDIKTEMSTAKFFDITKTKFGGGMGNYDYTTV